MKKIRVEQCVKTNVYTLLVDGKVIASGSFAKILRLADKEYKKAGGKL